MLRHRAALDWWIARARPGRVEAAARSRVLAALVLAEGWRPEAVAACCDGDRFRPAPLSAAEARLVDGLAGRTLRHPQMPRAVANDLPEWLEPYLERVFGHGLEREMAALNAPAPIDLRVNLLKADRETARRALAAEGITAEPTPLVADRPAPRRAGAAVAASPRSRTASSRCRTRARRSPRCWPMRGPGCGSSISAPGPAARPWHSRPAWPIAASSSPATSRPGGSSAPPAGCAAPGSAMSSAALLASERDKWVKRHAGSFDRVLVDAPCLGTGTWRRNPDAKWRSRPEDLAELIERQQQILRSAARLVRPGGRLVYATCSLLREEDEAQAEAFLAADARFLAGAGRARLGRDDRRHLARRRATICS